MENAVDRFLSLYFKKPLSDLSKEELLEIVGKMGKYIEFQWEISETSERMFKTILENR
jgi:hypothetical protein